MDAPSRPAEAPSDVVGRAAALTPLIAAESEAIERDRRLTPPVLAALHEAGLFRLLLPRSCGGREVDPATFLRVIETIARADASTAWCLCQAAGCSMAAAYLPAPAARGVFGDANAVLAWGPPSRARAVAVEGGYRLSGSWSFASGCRHASWLGGHAPIYETDATPRLASGGAPVHRTLLFPAHAAAIDDVWDVIGLRGTASDRFSVADLFVPESHAVARDDPAERREAGPLYRLTTNALYASGFAGVALGIAGSALDGFVALAREKRPRGESRPIRENAVVQAQTARAAARLSAARLFLDDALDAAWATVTAGRDLDLDGRIHIRLAATHAIHEAKATVDAVYHAAGADAIFTANGLERRFRDVNTVSQQVQGRQAHFEMVGRHMLGLEASSVFL